MITLHLIGKAVKLVLKIALTVILLVALAVAAVNAYVVLSSRDAVIAQEQAVEQAGTFQADCIVVLGASVYEDGSLCTMLENRVDDAIALYNAGVAPKIIMSGDGRELSYNEPGAMKAYAVAKGVPSEDIFCDRAGVDSFNTMYRVANVFGAKHIVVCTQTYHQYRCLYLARSFGMEAVGVPCDYYVPDNQLWYDFRELFSRCKAVAEVLAGHTSNWMEDPISLSESGDVTNKY